MAESAISLEGDDSVIIRRQQNLLPGRYQERWRVKNGGNIFFEELYASYFTRAEDPARFLIRTSARRLKNLGMALSPDEVKKTDYEEGVIFYASKKDAQRTCVVFNGNFGDMQYGNGNRHLSGGVCQFNNKALSADLESAVLDILGRMRYDEGALNRTKAAQRPRGAASRSADMRPIAVKWQGRPAMIAGTVELVQGQDAGSMTMSLPNNEGTCSGSYETQKRSWKVACTNGASASGTFTPLGSGQGSKGTGKDNLGNSISFTIGGAA